MVSSNFRTTRTRNFGSHEIKQNQRTIIYELIAILIKQPAMTNYRWLFFGYLIVRKLFLESLFINFDRRLDDSFY